MSGSQLNIILAGSGYLGKSIVNLANNYSHGSIIEYCRTLKSTDGVRFAKILMKKLII